MKNPATSSVTVRLLALCGFVSVFFSNCEDKDATGVGIAEKAEATGNAAPEPKEVEPLVILTWDEYFAPEVVSTFSERTGIPVKFRLFSNLDEMRGILRSNPAEIDLVVTDGGALSDLVELQLLQPVNRDLIPQYDNLDWKFLGLRHDPENKYSVPYMWGTTLVAYRTDKIEEPAQSWKVLWDERYRGKVLMVDDGFDVYAAALLSMGQDINEQNSAVIEKATKSLLTQADQLQSRFVDILEIREKLLSGDCWISMTYSSDAAVLAEENENIGYFIPEEGAPLWVDSFVISRESPHLDAAHQFLNFLCEPEIAALNSNSLLCASVNKAAKPFLSQEVLKDPTLYLHPEVLSRCQLDAQSSPARQSEVNQGLKKVFDLVRANAEKDEISLLIWKNYLTPEVVEKFERETNSRVIVTEAENSETLKQMLASTPDKFDVIVTDEASLRELMDLRLLKENHFSTGTSPVNPSAFFLRSPVDPDFRYSVPYLWGTTVLAGNSEALQGATPSWDLLWRDDLRTAILDEPTDLIWLALLAEGVDPATSTKHDVDLAAAKLAARFPDITSSMMDFSTALEKLSAGELDLIVSYSGDALELAEDTSGITVVIPQEGAPLWVDSFAISRDSKNPKRADQFVRFMVEAGNSASSANHLQYASPNRDSIPMIESSLRENPIRYPREDVLEKCQFVRYPDDLVAYINQTISTIISRSRANSIAAQTLEGSTQREDSNDE